jgi:hypothetical protein
MLGQNHGGQPCCSIGLKEGELVLGRGLEWIRQDDFEERVELWPRICLFARVDEEVGAMEGVADVLSVGRLLRLVSM